MIAAEAQIPTQYIRDASGEPIAVILSIATYQQIKAMLKENGVTFVWDDEGEVNPTLKQQLLRQSAAIQAGERGITLEDAMTILGLTGDGSTIIDASVA